ncbi:hypothetical protein RRG08_019921 [Elysia crispata]|uniref:Uncharacterized protein n=1 Tax=Elysia crispata TaxID=231223 RepID=A0AAE0XMH6_9GAST|nr:hypothetical protein RRG08_019921 [Elysia crispata]
MNEPDTNRPQQLSRCVGVRDGTLDPGHSIPGHTTLDRCHALFATGVGRARDAGVQPNLKTRPSVSHRYCLTSTKSLLVSFDASCFRRFETPLFYRFYASISPDR